MQKKFFREEEFNEWYNNILRENLEHLEKEKKGAQKENKYNHMIIFIIIFIIILINVLIVKTAFPPSIELILTSIFITGVCGGFVYIILESLSRKIKN